MLSVPNIIVSRCPIEVSAIQRNDDASLQTAIGLSTGRSVRKLITQTLNACIGQGVLEHIGATGPDECCQDVLSFHSDLLVSHLGFLHEVNIVHTSIPWALVLAFRSAELPQLLVRMEKQWKFVTSCLDKLNPKSSLYKAVFWTRSQAYREAMTVAESHECDLLKTFIYGINPSQCSINI